MVQFCREHGVPHQICGKVIVATSEDEVPRLEELRRRGEPTELPACRRLGQTAPRDRTPCARAARSVHTLDRHD